MRSFTTIAIAGFALGCSAGGADGSNKSPSSASGGASAAGGGDTTPFVGAATGGTGATQGSGGAGAALSAGGGAFKERTGDPDCIAEVRQGEQVPLDIYIMFDTSCSMGCSPWKTGPGQCCNDPDARIHAVRQAVETFLRDPASVGIGVGIGYFGYMAFETTSCDPSAYATPDVGIAPLPDNAQPIVDSLNAHIPIGETPTGAAIRGACSVSQGWQQQNPSHIVVNLLVTDGVPEAPLTMTCNPTIDDATAAAQECNSGPTPIPTFVLGVGGNLDLLGQIATGGGTGQAYLVEGTDVASQVLAALNNIRGEAQIPCEFQIPDPPPGEVIDTEAVNVEYENNGVASTVYFVGDGQSCQEDEGGWYYDDPASPGRILLCPSTCNVVENTVGGEVDIALGCKTVTIPR